jgi:hypothetical protein
MSHVMKTRSHNRTRRPPLLYVAGPATGLKRKAKGAGKAVVKKKPAGKKKRKPQLKNPSLDTFVDHGHLERLGERWREGMSDDL